jgi:hypothetical protein
MRLHPDQLSQRVLEHEIGHLLGLRHMQQRMDSDRFVEFNSAECGGGPSELETPGGRGDFETRAQYMNYAQLERALMAGGHSREEIRSVFDVGHQFDVGAYDFASVMHYSLRPKCLRLARNAPPLPEGLSVGLNHPQPSDFRAVNTMFACFPVRISFRGALLPLQVSGRWRLDTLERAVAEAVGVDEWDLFLFKGDLPLVAERPIGSQLTKDDVVFVFRRRPAAPPPAQPAQASPAAAAAAAELEAV